MLNEWNDKLESKAARRAAISNVVRSPTWREKRRLWRESENDHGSLPFDESKLTWEHWAIALVLILSVVWGIYTIVVTS
ncbi:MAG TPA: hypothetical protein VEB68_01685 [Croceibacterium sp.]|nr:hypothetical protein [Croceibacterium sp.]